MKKALTYLSAIALLATPLNLPARNKIDQENKCTTNSTNCCGASDVSSCNCTVCTCDATCSCKQSYTETTVTRGKLSAKKILNAVAKAFVHIGSLLHAKQAKDKVAVQASILGLVETGLELAAESAEAQEYQKNIESKSIKIMKITEEMVKKLTESSLHTESVEEYKKHGARQSSHFTITAIPQDERDKTICLDYIKNLATMSEEIIKEQDVAMAPHFHSLIKDLLAWISDGSVILEKSTESCDKSICKSIEEENVKTIGKLKIINRTGKKMDVIMQETAE